MTSAPLSTLQGVLGATNAPIHKSVSVEAALKMAESDQCSDISDYGEVTQKKTSEFFNSGDSDVSPDGSPSQFLILRGLEPTATEELVAKGVTKLYKPSEREAVPTTKKGNAKVASTTGDANLGARDGSLRRILLVRDRHSNESWRYAFAEFATVDVWIL